MLVIFSLFLFSLLFAALGVQALVAFAAWVLLLPLVAIPLSAYIGITLSAAFGTILVLAVILSSTLKSTRAWQSFPEVVIFFIAWIFLWLLTSRWPEFYNIGEHLRDFSILSEVIREPLQPREPWCNSLPLGYYIYWYRLGAIFSRVFNLGVAETCQLLISFAPALTLAILIRCFRKLGGGGLIISFFVASLIIFGSNISAIQSVFQHGHWWSPSRAISIGITEFPIWSYLLGDLHPHYLSLVIPPFLLLLALEGSVSEGARKIRFLELLTLGFFGAALLAAANTWDLVGLGLLATPISLGALYRSGKNYRSEYFSWYCLVLFGILALFSMPKIGSVPIELKLVTEALPAIDPLQFVAHWGLPLCLAFLALVVLKGRWKEHLLPISILVGSLLILVFQNLFYFDDLYVGENERLNTIFKLSAFTWVPLHFAAFLLALRAYKLKANALDATFKFAIIASLSLFFVFFVSTSQNGRPVLLPRYFEPRDLGLSRVEAEYPGAALAILELRKLSGPVLGWNEPAYSDAGIFCSLSEQGCYLGWQNHLRMMYRVGLDEFDRRQGIINVFYTSSDCQALASLAKAEKISAIVISQIERRRFAALPIERCPGEWQEFDSIKILKSFANQGQQ